MTIQVGDKLPEAKFRVMTAEGRQVKPTDDIFKGKKVADAVRRMRGCLRIDGLCLRREPLTRLNRALRD